MTMHQWSPPGKNKAEDLRVSKGYNASHKESAPQTRHTPAWGIALAALLVIGMVVGWWLNEIEKKRVAVNEQLVAGRAAMQQQWLQARESFAEVCRIVPNNAEATEAIKQIDGYLNTAQGGLKITTVPAGASVYLSGSTTGRILLGKSPLTLGNLPLGSAKIVVKHPDCEPMEKQIPALQCDRCSRKAPRCASLRPVHESVFHQFLIIPWRIPTQTIPRVQREDRHIGWRKGRYFISNVRFITYQARILPYRGYHLKVLCENPRAPIG